MGFISEVKSFFNIGSEAPLRHELGAFANDAGSYEDSVNKAIEEEVMGMVKAAVDIKEDADLLAVNDYPTDIVFDHTSKTPAMDMDNETLRNKVFDYMAPGGWHTLAAIHFACGGTEASCSARLRDFRKLQYGEHLVERKHVGNRLYEYRLTVNTDV